MASRSKEGRNTRCYNALKINGVDLLYDSRNSELKNHTPSNEKLCMTDDPKLLQKQHEHRINLYKLAWVLSIGGSIAIGLAWYQQVPSFVGWIGFAVVISGIVLSVLVHRP